MAFADMQPRLAETATRTAFLIVDTESIPDGRLLAAVKYPGETLTPEAAVERAQAEAREASWNNSDFIPVTFQIPVAVCVVRVSEKFELQAFTCLDAPQFRTREIVTQFWGGFARYAKSKAKLVTFNGRGFDLPLLELAAFRYGICAQEHYLARDRYRGPIDLMDMMTNFGGTKLVGGLDLLAKLIGKPGKMDVSGDRVYAMYREGKLQEINDYCLCDTLDTYFIFLRTRVLTGDISVEREAELVASAKELLETKAGEFPILRQYLDHWGDGEPA
jgi:predicted PolB exonuclease-like 3'-5' exonuclease